MARRYNPANRTEEGPVNPTARWPDRLEHLATLLRADALAIVAPEGDRFTTLFSHRLSGATDWLTILNADVFARTERGAVATAVPAGRWRTAASYAVVARIEWTSPAFLVALRQDVPFDPVEALGATAGARLLELNAAVDRQLTETQRWSGDLADRVTVLERLGGELAHARDPGELLAMAAEDVARRMGAGAASIMVVEDGRLRLRASVGLPHAVALGSERRIGEGIAGWAAAHGQKLVLRGPVHDTRFAGVDPGAGEAVVLPIVEGGEVLGVLSVKRPDRPGGFDDRHDALDVLAADLGTVLRATKAVGRLHRERERALTFANVARAVAAGDVPAALGATLELGHHAVALRDAGGRVMGSQSAAGDDRCRDAAVAASDTRRGERGEPRVGFARHGGGYAEEEAALAQQTADTLALLGRSFSSAPAQGTRVLAVEDHPVMRLGIRALLEREGLAVAGTCATCAEAVGLLGETAPDVVLLDLLLPDATGTEAIVRLREAAGAVPIVVFSVEGTPTLIRAAFAAGARGYVTKDAPVARLVAAIRAAAAGLVVMGPDEAAMNAAPQPASPDDRPTSPPARSAPENGRKDEPATPQEALTPRELELLRYMAEGYTNKEIARAMVLAEDTVKKAVQTLIAKLGATDRTHAVVVALRTHLID